MDAYWYLILLIVFWTALTVVPRMMLKRSISNVIRIFETTHSRCSENPKTPPEMGLTASGFNPLALQTLVRSGVVRFFEDGRLCLIDEKLPALVRVSDSQDRGSIK